MLCTFCNKKENINKPKPTIKIMDAWKMDKWTIINISGIDKTNLWTIWQP